ncbi:hypothetical protein K1719_012246 [Acacia pycnantha]|nr:hypothetical protein K1719_012246 [Acacia pycnantha]
MTAKGRNVIVPPEEKKRLVRRWRLTLIVKMLGRMIREEHMVMKLKQSDYTCALTGGPWLIMDHYLAVQPWKEVLCCRERKSTSNIAAWVRISALLMVYHDKGVLYAFGCQIGRVLKLDMTTSKRSKGRFARLCRTRFV